MRTDDVCPQGDRPPPEQRAPALDHHEKNRIRRAAAIAAQRYPGPVGELVSRELSTWEEFGYRLDKAGLTARLVNHLLTPPGAGQ